MVTFTDFLRFRTEPHNDRFHLAHINSSEVVSNEPRLEVALHSPRNSFYNQFFTEMWKPLRWFGDFWRHLAILTTFIEDELNRVRSRVLAYIFYRLPAILCRQINTLQANHSLIGKPTSWQTIALLSNYRPAVKLLPCFRTIALLSNHLLTVEPLPCCQNIALTSNTCSVVKTSPCYQTIALLSNYPLLSNHRLTSKQTCRQTIIC